jgi:predicted DsbA family dithiol-disulfide isomerase
VADLRFIVYSDYLCPWCVNADVRLRRLEREYQGRIEFEWRSFLLRPRPRPIPETPEHAARALEKFRQYTKSWERVGADADAGEFRVWATNCGPPSHSIPAHLVAKAAARVGPDAFQRMHERLLSAYFVDNLDTSDHDTLLALWREQAIDEEAFAAHRDPAILAEVLSQHNEAIEFGATGVPAVRLDGNPAVIVGAQPEALYRRWIERSLARLSASSPPTPTHEEHT